MTWTKLGAEFLTDPDLLQVSRSARLCHVEATIWSNHHLTDGRIPGHMMHRIGDARKRDIDALVAAGLLIVDGDDYILKDFHVNQPSKDKVLADQEASRISSERNRRHGRGDHSMCDRCAYVIRHGRVTDRVTDDPPSPTRTDRSVPTVREGAETGGEGSDLTSRPVAALTRGTAAGSSDESEGRADHAPARADAIDATPDWLA